MKVLKLKYFLAAVLLAGALIATNLFGFSGAIKNFFYSFSSGSEEVIWSAGNEVSDFLAGFLNAKGLKRDLERTVSDNLQLTQKIVGLYQVKEENLELRKALDLGLEKEFELETADVIGKDGFRDSLLLNKGQKDGIPKGLPVITAQKVLVGRVGEVYPDFSEVTLITSKELSFDAKIFEKDIYGLIKGNGGEKISLQLVPKDKDIAVEDLVITSDLGGIFPKGLLVGRIEKIQKSDIETFQTAVCQPLFEVGELKSVLIIKDF
jgi:rod shape-determining protein MreC